jgi:hypothetical protein
MLLNAFSLVATVILLVPVVSVPGLDPELSSMPFRYIIEVVPSQVNPV